MLNFAFCDIFCSSNLGSTVNSVMLLMENHSSMLGDLFVLNEKLVQSAIKCFGTNFLKKNPLR